MISCDGCKHFNECEVKLDVTTRWDNYRHFVPGFSCRVLTELDESEGAEDEGS